MIKLLKDGIIGMCFITGAVYWIVASLPWLKKSCDYLIELLQLINN